VNKSRRGALIMSLTAVLPVVIILAGARVIEWLAGGARTDDTLAVSLLAEACFLPFATLLVTTLLSVVIGALDARHYGQVAARRWLVIGVGFGLWWTLAARLLPEFDVFLVGRAVHGVLQVGCALWLYWLAFRVFPPQIAAREGLTHEDSLDAPR
jgi:hypothetical protein